MHNNPPIQIARIARQALKDTGFSDFDHSPCDFLFPKLKKELRDRRYPDDSDIKAAVKTHLEEQNKRILSQLFKSFI